MQGNKAREKFIALLLLLFADPVRHKTLHWNSRNLSASEPVDYQAFSLGFSAIASLSLLPSLVSRQCFSISLNFSSASCWIQSCSYGYYPCSRSSFKLYHYYRNINFPFDLGSIFHSFTSVFCSSFCFSFSFAIFIFCVSFFKFAFKVAAFIF